VNYFWGRPFVFFNFFHHNFTHHLMQQAASKVDETSYMCGFKPELTPEAKTKLPFAHMTGVRLGPAGSFHKDHIINGFSDMLAFYGRVSAYTKWGPNHIALLKLPFGVTSHLSATLDEYSKPERDNKVYKYIPVLGDGALLKEPHISLGKDETNKALFPIDSDILFNQAFIKLEGPHDPECTITLKL
jgi:hypothetical protein